MDQVSQSVLPQQALTESPDKRHLLHDKQALSQGSTGFAEDIFVTSQGSLAATFSHSLTETSSLSWSAWLLFSPSPT